MEVTRLEQLIVFKDQNPNDPFILYALATEYLKNQDVESALHYYEVLIRDHEDYVGTYYHLGKLYEALEKQDNAIKTYKKGMIVASRKNNRHALMELQAVYNAIMGIEPDDDF